MTGTTGTRLASIDALRGLDMAVIIGLDSLTHALAALFPESGFWQGAREQMGHVPWEGLALYDIVFPLFVFLAGASLFFSQQKHLAYGASLWKTHGRMWKRAAILVALGWLVNGGLEWNADSMRYASVLGLIGISCAAAGSLALLLKRAWSVALCAALILGGVWAAQHFCGGMEQESCANASIDALICPGRLHNGCYDPEGPLCIVSATALCLAGWLAGRFIALPGFLIARALGLMAIGAAAFALGIQGTVIKNIWTSAFVLSAAGVSCALLGAFRLVIEGLGLRAWAFPLRVIGMNALFIYIATNIIDFNALSWRIFCGSIRSLASEAWQPAAMCACRLLLAWLLCFALYRRKIFIKI